MTVDVVKELSNDVLIYKPKRDLLVHLARLYKCAIKTLNMIRSYD
jgi:hypothetical protein